MTWHPEIRAALRIALQFRMGSDARRHVERALTLLDADQPPPPRAWTCPRDSQPCAHDCDLTSGGLHGRCARAEA
jgi:hypothetical protein